VIPANVTLIYLLGLKEWGMYHAQEDYKLVEGINQKLIRNFAVGRTANSRVNCCLVRGDRVVCFASSKGRLEDH